MIEQAPNAAKPAQALRSSNTGMAVVPDSNRMSFCIYSAYNFSNRILDIIFPHIIITQSALEVNAAHRSATKISDCGQIANSGNF